MTSLLQRIANKLGLSPPPAEGRQRTASSPTNFVIVPQRVEAFERRLEQLLARQKNVSAGQVNFFGLAKVRDALGAEWPRIARRADEITRKAIERRLTAVDVYTRVDDVNYIIVFSQLSPAAAQVKCGIIGEEISKQLLGEQLPPDLVEVRTAVKQIDGTIKFDDVLPLDALAQSAAAALPVPEPAHAAADPAAPTDARSQPDLVYRPIWDVRRNAIATFLCIPETEPPPAPADGSDAAAAHFDHDIILLNRVLNDARGLIAARRRLVLGVPVHFETLTKNARRLDYVRLCQSLPETAEKLLVFELIGMPDGVPLNRVVDVLGYLKRFARSVIVRVPGEFPPSWLSPKSGVLAVGMDLGASSAPETQLIPILEKFAAKAAKAGFRAYVHGLRSLSLASAALGAGFDYVDGDIVNSVLDAPGDVQRFGIHDLYQRRLMAAQGAQPRC